jgi:hypothetical protein
LHKQTVAASGAVANPSTATTDDDVATTVNRADRWEMV